MWMAVESNHAPLLYRQVYSPEYQPSRGSRTYGMGHTAAYPPPPNTVRDAVAPQVAGDRIELSWKGV